MGFKKKAFLLFLKEYLQLATEQENQHVKTLKFEVKDVKGKKKQSSKMKNSQL